MLAPLVLGSAAVAVVAQNGAGKVLEFVVRPHSPYKRFAFWIDRHKPESLTEHFHSNLQQMPFRSNTW